MRNWAPGDRSPAAEVPKNPVVGDRVAYHEAPGQIPTGSSGSPIPIIGLANITPVLRLRSCSCPGSGGEHETTMKLPDPEV